MKKVIIILAGFLLFSCSSKHTIYINKDNSAKIDFNVLNKESLIENLKEWGAVSNAESGSVISEADVREGFENDPNFFDIDIKSDEDSNFNGSLSVKDINQLFYNEEKQLPEEQKIFSITDNEGVKTLKIQLSIDNYGFLQENLPILQNETIDLLGPIANIETSREDYIDMISFTLQDKGPADLMASNISLKIVVDGSITEVYGGEQIDSNTCEITIPLIDIILLKEKLVYTISYN